MLRKLFFTQILWAIIRLIKFSSINFTLFTVLLSIKRQFLPGILFYEGIVSLILSTTSLLIFLWKDHGSVKDKVHGYYSIIISFFLVLTFHTTVITIVDRSISVFIISTVKNGAHDPGLVREKFITNFTKKGIDKRIHEQKEIGNIISKKGNMYLTRKGQLYHQFFSLIQKVYNTDGLIVGRTDNKNN
jgi:hypothetical protein